jgi:hypothetical protein
MQKYSQTYTQLSNLILGLSDYQRSKVLGFINYFVINQSGRRYYVRRRSKNFEAAILMLFLGFIFGILFWGSLDFVSEYFTTIP